MSSTFPTLLLHTYLFRFQMLALLFLQNNSIQLNEETDYLSRNFSIPLEHYYYYLMNFLFIAINFRGLQFWYYTCISSPLLALLNNRITNFIHLLWKILSNWQRDLVLSKPRHCPDIRFRCLNISINIVISRNFTSLLMWNLSGNGDSNGK